MGVDLAHVCFNNNQSLSSPCLPDTVGMGVDRAHVSVNRYQSLVPPSVPDTLCLGVDRAHVTCTSRAAASDATGLSSLLANVQFPTDDTTDATLKQRVMTMEASVASTNGTQMVTDAWSEQRANGVYYNDPLLHVSRAQPSQPSLPDTVGLGVDRAHASIDNYQSPMPYSVPDTVAMGVDRAHADVAGASVPIGDNGARVGVGCADFGFWNQQESNNHSNKCGRSVTMRRIGPTRHNAPNEFPLTDFANNVPVRVMGLNVKPTDDQLSDVSTSLRRHRRDGDDDQHVDPRSATDPTRHRIFDDAARRLGLYRVRSAPLPYVGGERDDCIAPLATRYGLGYIDGISECHKFGGAIACVPAQCAGTEASIQKLDATE